MAGTEADQIKNLKRRCTLLLKKIEKMEQCKKEYEGRIEIWKKEKQSLEFLLKEKTCKLAVLSEILNKRKYLH
jgi:hypothetical protein